MKHIQWFFRQSMVTYKSIFGIMDIKTFILTKIFSPLSSMLFFCYLALHAYGRENMADWVIGNAFATCVFPVFLGAGLVMIIERGIGTLRSIIASPTSRLVIFTSRSMMHIFNAVAVCILGLAMGIWIFKIDFSHVNLWMFGLIVVISMFAAIGLGMAFGSFGLVLRDINLFLNIFILGLIILSGANVALDQFPAPLLWISKAIPVTRGIEAARLLYDNASMSLIWPLVIQEFLMGILYFVIAYWMYRWMEYMARKHSTIDIY